MGDRRDAAKALAALERGMSATETGPGGRDGL